MSTHKKVFEAELEGVLDHTVKFLFNQAMKQHMEGLTWQVAQARARFEAQIECYRDGKVAKHPSGEIAKKLELMAHVGLKDLKRVDGEKSPDHEGEEI